MGIKKYVEFVKESKIPNIVKGDIIFPFYTEKLREHLKEAMLKQSTEAKKKQDNAGWGVTKFGEPNRKSYGNFLADFYNYFVYNNKILDTDLNLISQNPKCFMVASDVVDNEFSLLPLNDDIPTSSMEYFKGFKFNVNDYGKDFTIISN